MKHFSFCFILPHPRYSYYLMQLREKGNDATQQVLRIMAQSRRICRYIVALIGYYYSPKTYRDWQQYLEVGDEQLEFKKIHEKVQKEVKELMYHRNQLRALMDDNSVCISPEIYKFFHETFHLYHNFASVSELDSRGGGEDRPSGFSSLCVRGLAPPLYLQNGGMALGGIPRVWQ